MDTTGTWRLARPPIPGLSQGHGERRQHAVRVSIDVACTVELGGKTFPMTIQNASITGLLLRWDFNAYRLLRNGTPVVVYCRMEGVEMRAEGNVARVEYRPQCVRIGLRDVVWYR